ncbi:MAG: hypothetical protein KME29_04965 [Calothrix sp. FI2-JRJ7]|jgi:hypothetical protein|nr:hypothetical protein [Calothrix sp. FI2-JRJ7]
MSSFNVEETYKDPKEWKQVALARVGNNGLQAHFFGGAAVALVVGVMSNPLTGALVLGYVLFSAFEKGRSQENNFEAVRKGCLAHVLEGSDFRSYARQVGREAILEELKYAAEEEYQFSDAALDYLDVEAPELIEGSKQPNQLTNKLEVVVDTESIEFKEELPTDLTKDLAKNSPRIIVYGVPGSGKDFFLSHLYRDIKALHGDKATIFMLDCKDEPKETGYFQGVIDKLYRKAVFKSSAKDVFEWLKKVIKEYDEFDAGTGFKVLACNELAALNSSLSELPKDKELGAKPIQWWIGKLSRYGSSGDSSGIKIFLASQNGHGDSLKLSGGDKAIFTPFLIAKDESMSETELILQANVIPQDAKISTNEMLKLCAISPVKRCMFHGGLNKWIPVPELENYSGYNRDKREFLQRPGQSDALTDEERAQLTSRTNEQTNLVIAKLEASNKTLDNFIKEDLNITDDEIFNQIKGAIITALKQGGRKDLLKKFGISV